MEKFQFWMYIIYRHICTSRTGTSPCKTIKVQSDEIYIKKKQLKFYACNSKISQSKATNFIPMLIHVVSNAKLFKIYHNYFVMILFELLKI